MPVRHSRWLVACLAAMVLGASCTAAPNASTVVSEPSANTETSAPVGPSQAPSPVTAGLPPAFQHVFEIPADPITVSPRLDVSAAAEKDITAASGGTLTATAADGTRFVLSVPDDALSADTHVRMVPASSIDGMPFGTEPHAVQLEPEGLHFLTFVTLTITPPSAIPVDEQVLFGWQGTGEDFTLAPPADNSAQISIKLLHFSGAGVTTAAAAQIAAVQPRIGATAESRITSAIAAELGRARQAALLGQSDGDVDQDAIVDFLGQFWTEVVKPRMDVAGRSCADGTLAIQTYLGYHRQLQLLGAGDSDDMSDEPNLVKLVAEVCVREEYQNCRDNHVIQNMVPTWLGWERNLQLLGAPDPATSAQLEAYARKCLVFEMRFESQASLDGDSGWDSSVRATVELRFDTDVLRFEPTEGELDNFLFKFKSPGGSCTITSIPGGGIFHPIAFKFFRATKTPNDLIGYVRDLQFDYNPGATSESVKVTCPDYSTTIPKAGFWSGSFLALHRGEGGVIDNEGGGTSGIPAQSYAFTATDWDIFGNAYYAKKEWIKSGKGITEAGTLKLYHTPE